MPWKPILGMKIHAVRWILWGLAREEYMNFDKTLVEPPADPAEALAKPGLPSKPALVVSMARPVLCQDRPFELLLERGHPSLHLTCQV